jgi:hypothetical protein
MMARVSAMRSQRGFLYGRLWRGHSTKAVIWRRRADRIAAVFLI